MTSADDRVIRPNYGWLLAAWAAILGSAGVAIVFAAWSTVDGAFNEGDWAIAVAVPLLGVLTLRGFPSARWTLGLTLVGAGLWHLLLDRSTGWHEPAVAVMGGVFVTAGWAVAVLPGMRDALRDQRDRLDARGLGPLADDRDALRWVSILETWTEAGAVGTGHRRRLLHRLTHFTEARSCISDPALVDRIRGLRGRTLPPGGQE